MPKDNGKLLLGRYPLEWVDLTREIILTTPEFNERELEDVTEEEKLQERYPVRINLLFSKTK